MARRTNTASPEPAGELIETHLTGKVKFRGQWYRPGQPYWMSAELRAHPEIAPLIKKD